VLAAQLWSIAVHCGQHRSPLEIDQNSAGVDSNSPHLLAEPDVSLTVWFGATAPASNEGNWVQSMPGKSWSALLRLYGPLEPWFDKKWRLGDVELVWQSVVTSIPVSSR
jgi:hypothetical protein